MHSAGHNGFPSPGASGAWRNSITFSLTAHASRSSLQRVSRERCSGAAGCCCSGILLKTLTPEAVSRSELFSKLHVCQHPACRRLIWLCDCLGALAATSPSSSSVTVHVRLWACRPPLCRYLPVLRQPFQNKAPNTAASLTQITHGRLSQPPPPPEHQTEYYWQ